MVNHFGDLVHLCVATSWTLWWMPDSHHAERDTERSGLPAFWEENPQGHKRCVCRVFASVWGIFVSARDERVWLFCFSTAVCFSTCLNWEGWGGLSTKSCTDWLSVLNFYSALYFTMREEKKNISQMYHLKSDFFMHFDKFLSTSLLQVFPF